MIMRLAPIGAFGAMAFTIGKYGVGTLVQLGQLIVCFYITCILFVVVVLGSIARASGFSIFKFIRYIREELLIVLGTSSSESALPRMLDKMEKLGCRKSVVGLVIPTGYSFNPDGTSIYLTMAAVFIARPLTATWISSIRLRCWWCFCSLQRGGGRNGQRIYRAGGHHFGGGPSAGGGPALPVLTALCLKPVR